MPLEGNTYYTTIGSSDGSLELTISNVSKLVYSIIVQYSS